jgi:hypothetical protein
LRRGLVGFWDELDEKSFLIWHPLHCFVEHGVEKDGGNLLHVPGSGVANPQLDGIGSNVDEGEALAVGGPDRVTGAHAGGKGDGSLLALGDSNQGKACGAGSNAVTAGSIVPAVILRLDPSTSEAQERRSQASDGGIVLPRDEENGVIGRAYGERAERARA